MAELSDMQAKRLAEKLAELVRKGDVDSVELQRGLRQRGAHQEQQRAAGRRSTRRP